MLQRIKQYSANGLARVTSIIVIMIALPLSLIFALFAFATAITAVAIAQHRLRKAGAAVVGPGGVDATAKPRENNSHKAPIEGSYTVIDRSPVPDTEPGL